MMGIYLAAHLNELNIYFLILVNVVSLSCLGRAGGGCAVTHFEIILDSLS